MDLEDELKRLLRDDQLDIPVRTGAEWSVVAGARRRRQRNGMLAAVGSALGATLLVGAGVALVSGQSDQPVQPAVPSVSQTWPNPGSTTSLDPSQLQGSPPQPQVPGNASGVPNPTGKPTRTSIPPTMLRTTTSKPDPTSSEPSTTSSPAESSTQQPATEPNTPGQ
ncbi:hypothetical protein [Saccharopolyspora sp. 5N708]|uniref:hypothetical protein n=1 Tax=Saccharopolyspora sp. 5N708 TaxID=3457424 RepID=UPI003FD47F22